MNKALKITLIATGSIFILIIMGVIIAFFSTANVANKDEYKLGNDTIKSIKAVVEKRPVSTVGTSKSIGVTTKKIGYKSDSVQKDLLKYTEYLRTEEGFILTKDMDLTVIPSSVELGKRSKDEGKLIMMTIDYDAFGYTIIIQKGKGTLEVY